VGYKKRDNYWDATGNRVVRKKRNCLGNYIVSGKHKKIWPNTQQVLGGNGNTSRLGAIRILGEETTNGGAGKSGKEKVSRTRPFCTESHRGCTSGTFKLPKEEMTRGIKEVRSVARKRFGGS